MKTAREVIVESCLTASHGGQSIFPDDAVKDADLLLAALDAAGYAVVPKEHPKNGIMKSSKV